MFKALIGLANIMIIDLEVHAISEGFILLLSLTASIPPTFLQLLTNFIIIIIIVIIL